MRLLGKPKAAGGNSQLYADDVFSPYTYTGTGAAQTITNGIDLAGEGGLVWCKNRGKTTHGMLHDTVRGVTKYLFCPATTGEMTNSTGNGLVAFNSDGFSLGTDTSYSINTSSFSYVSWTFRKAPRFFDIVTYTGNAVAGREVAHELGVAPGMMIIKTTNTNHGWFVWHHSQLANKFFSLDSAILFGSDQTVLVSSVSSNSFSLTNSSVSSGNFYSANSLGNTYVAYLFASLPGISKVGSYIGNGSSQIIDCGFSTGARFILIKRVDSDGDWFIWDSGRGIVNDCDPHLSINTGGSEVISNDSIDPYPSGFIVNQKTATNINVSGATYAYLVIS